MFERFRRSPALPKNGEAEPAAKAPVAESPVWVSLEHLVPGWDGVFAHPRHLTVEAGIRADMERLRGSRYLVAVLYRDLDYDALPRTLFLEQGFVDFKDAAQYAQTVLDKHCQATLADNPAWRAMPARDDRWPTVDAPAEDMLRVPPRQFGDGSGYYSREIHVAVIPIDPDQPLSADLFHLMGNSIALHAYLERTGQSALGYEEPIRPKTTRVTGADPVPRMSQQAFVAVNRVLSLLLAATAYILVPLSAYIAARKYSGEPLPDDDTANGIPILGSYVWILFISGCVSLLALSPGIRSYLGMPRPRPRARLLELAFIALPLLLSVVAAVSLWVMGG